MGIVEDKVIKNNYASEYIYNAYKDTKTCGIIEEDSAFGIKRIAEPIGVIAAVVPTTNPTSTAIFKCLLALKTRNAIIISPHPRAKNCTIAAAKLVLEAAVKAGAPEGIYGANSGAICIEVLGNFDIGGDNMTENQREAVPFYVRLILDKFGLNAKNNVTYHAWWSAAGKSLGDYIKGKSAKTCPGTALWIKKCEEDKNIYWLCYKMANKLRGTL